MQPKIFFTSDHDIDPALIDPDALYVVKRLRDAGFTSYLVGGSVRDLLVKKCPKDYDISTSALPEQIKQLFQRQCILIGRRFRLAHIRCGHKILEVSTFRSGDNDSDLIVHDNQWGSPEEDVLRRDFTINGLFYDPSNHSIIDYVGGWDDIHKRILRTIGDPEIRFKQDPVRMIRLLKFRARFGFEIDPACRNALISCREEITKSSPARILEEFLRMLESGASAPFFYLMNESGILKLLFPSLSHYLRGEHGKEIYSYLTCADKMNLASGKKPLDRAVLTACLLYPILEHEVKTQFLDKNVIPHIGDVMMITSSVIKNFVTASFSHFPRRISATTGFILTTQYRLTPPGNKKHHSPRLFRNSEFGAALKFLKIRAVINEKVTEQYLAWKNLYKQTERQADRRGHHHPAPHRRREPQHARSS